MPTAVLRIGAVATLLTTCLLCGSCAVEDDDNSPPEIKLDGIDSGGKYLAADKIIPNIRVTDDRDGAPDVIVKLDGQTYVPGAAIDAPGPHLFTVTARDQSGNMSAISHPFGIYERSQLRFAVSPSQFTCVEDANGARLSGRLGLGGPESAAAGVAIWSIRFWMLNENGMPLNNKPLQPFAARSQRIGETTLESPKWRGWYWDLSFTADFETSGLVGCPASILVTGRGLLAGAWFDFEGQGPAEPKGDVEGDLQKQGADDSETTPVVARGGGDGCEWKWRYDALQQDKEYRSERGETYSKKVYLYAYGGQFEADSYAFDKTIFSSTADAGAVGSHAAVTFWLEGPETCCAEPEITCKFRPRFKARTVLDPPGQAISAGLIEVNSDECDLKRSVLGGVQSGGSTATTVKFSLKASVGKDGPSASANIETQLSFTPSDAKEDLFQIGTDDHNTVAARQVSIAAVSEAKQEILADSGPLNWFADAQAELMNADVGINVHGVCGPYERDITFWNELSMFPEQHGIQDRTGASTTEPDPAPPDPAPKPHCRMRVGVSSITSLAADMSHEFFHELKAFDKLERRQGQFQINSTFKSIEDFGWVYAEFQNKCGQMIDIPASSSMTEWNPVNGNQQQGSSSEQFTKMCGAGDSIREMPAYTVGNASMAVKLLVSPECYGDSSPPGE